MTDIREEPFVRDFDGDVYRRETDGTYRRWDRIDRNYFPALWLFDDIEKTYAPIEPATDPELPEPVDLDAVAAQPSPRADLLREAESLVTGDRNKTYGSPTANFTHTAAMWSIYLSAKFGVQIDLDPSDVSVCQILLKTCRMVAQPKRDNWADVAGYAGCGYEADVESGRIEAA